MEQPITTATRNMPEMSREELKTQLIGPKASRALAFQTVAVRHFGPAAGIFCRQLLFWDGSGWDGEGWIYKSMQEWEDETGLTRRNWERARKVLTGKRVMEEKKAIGPDGRQRLFYRLDLVQLMDAVGDDLPNAKPSTFAQDCTVLPSGDAAQYYRAGTMPTNSDQTVQKTTHKRTQKEDTPLTPLKGERVRKRDKSKDKGSPAAAIEAIREHDKYGTSGDMKEMKAWEIAETWDFTIGATPRRGIRDAISPYSREDSDHHRAKLERIALKAVQGDAVTDSHGLEDSSEGGMRGPLSNVEIEAVRREIVNNPKSAANHHARYYWEGQKKWNEVVIQVLDAVNESLFGNRRDIRDFGDAVETMLKRQKAYLDSKKPPKVYRRNNEIV